MFPLFLIGFVLEDLLFFIIDVKFTFVISLIGLIRLFLSQVWVRFDNFWRF